MVNLTLRWPLLAAALRDLTLVFPKPLACFRLLWLLAFTFLAKGEPILADLSGTRFGSAYQRT